MILSNPNNIKSMIMRNEKTKKMYETPECSVTSVLIKTGICGSDPLSATGYTRNDFDTWGGAENSEFTM